MIKISAISNYLNTLDFEHGYGICNCNVAGMDHIVVPIAMYDGGGSDKSAIIEMTDCHWILSKVYDDEILGIRAETLIVSVLEDLDIITTWLNAISIGTIPKTHYAGNCRRLRFNK